MEKLESMKEKFLTFYSSPSARLIEALVLMNTAPIELISGLRARRLDVPASSRSAVYRGLPQDTELIPTIGFFLQRLVEAPGNALCLWQRASDVNILLAVPYAVRQAVEIYRQVSDYPPRQ